MESISLEHYSSFPDDFLSVEPNNICSVFKGPSLISIKGKSEETLFISSLLHGNELSSLFVLQKFAQHLKNHQPQKSLIIFIGNVFACEKNERFLSHQQDYNRIWSNGNTIEHQLAQDVMAFAQKSKLFASVDIHNNTGTNPLYGCVSKTDASSLYLASLFSNTLVYFLSPTSAQSLIFSEFTHAVTLECGRSGDPEGIKHAYQFILDLLATSSLEHKKQKETHLFHTVARIKLKPNCSMGFDQEPADLQAVENFELLNFTQLEPGSLFAKFKGDHPPLEVTSNDGLDQFNKFFKVHKNNIYIKKSFTPSMLTKNKAVITQDCLGYIMEEFPL